MKPRDIFPKLVIYKDPKYPECNKHYVANNREELLNIGLTILDFFKAHEDSYYRNITKNKYKDLADYIAEQCSSLTRKELLEICNLSKKTKETMKHNNLGFGDTLEKQLASYKRELNDLLLIKHYLKLVDTSLQNCDGNKAWIVIQESEFVKVDIHLFDEIEYE